MKGSSVVTVTCDDGFISASNMSAVVQEGSHLMLPKNHVGIQSPLRKYRNAIKKKQKIVVKQLVLTPYQGTKLKQLGVSNNSDLTPDRLSKTDGHLPGISGFPHLQPRKISIALKLQLVSREKTSWWLNQPI